MIIAIILSVLIILILGCFIALNCYHSGYDKVNPLDSSPVEGKAEYVIPENGTPYFIKRKPDGSISDNGFKIISSTDLHLETELSDFTLEVLSRFIEKEKPDLVVLVGDNTVNRTDTVMQDKLKNFFDERKQYWAFVLGNHDGETLKRQNLTDNSRKWAYEALMGSKYCITRDEGGDDVAGYGNFTVNVKNSAGNIIQTLFFMDSGDYVTEEIAAQHGFTYEKSDAFIQNSQKEWYSRRIDELTAENGGVTPKSLLYFHIPLPEHLTAWNNRKKDGVDWVYGNKFEGVGSSKYNNGVFSLLKEKGSTHTVICGHDHINDFCIEYEGIRLAYSQAMSYESYGSRGNKFQNFVYRLDNKVCYYADGITVTMLRKDGTVDLIPKYAQYENVFYGLEKYYDDAKITGTYK